MTTWAELEKQGVRRCCACFTNGKRCARRASPASSGGSWCEKHAPLFAKVEADFQKMMKDTKGGNAPTKRDRDEDEED